MPLLIDTYNVLHTVGVLPPDLAGIDIQGLIGLLQHSRFRDEKTTLICDGVPDPKAGPRSGLTTGSAITIRYSGHGRPADDLIHQLIRASTAPRRLIVVSSDNVVLRNARKRRCRQMTSHQFLQQLVDDARAGRRLPASSAGKPASAVSADQVDHWINIFKLDEATVAIPPGSGVESLPALLKPAAAESLPNPASAAPSAPAQPPAAPPELPPGLALPPSLIAEAEEFWARNNRTDRK